MKKLLLASSIAALSLTGVSAHAEKGQVYINPAVGYITFDGERELEDANVGALGLEYQFSEDWGVEILGVDANSETEEGNVHVDYRSYRLDGLYYLGSEGKLKPYLAAGVGDADFKANGERENETQINLGGGVRYLLSDSASIRADLRGIHGEDDSTWDALFTLGISFAFGGSSPAPAPAPEPVKEAAPEPAPAPAPAPVEPAAPADSDNDGVIDDNDQCPNTPAGVAVDAAGCPLDSDKDGVADYLDKCPNSAEGARVDSKGCKLKKVRVDEIKLNVQFPTNSSVVTKASYPEIEAVASFMKKHADLVVDIEGHTDSLGKATYNKSLSQRRADSVAKILVDTYGIEAGRVNATGYGEEQPIAVAE
ncbi:MAG: OmpA family protein [Pseudomonadales bacterium]|nr:OmpA family protein [Pseudomonadales bacterium]